MEEDSEDRPWVTSLLNLCIVRAVFPNQSALYKIKYIIKFNY